MTKITHTFFSLSLIIVAATTARAQSAASATNDTGPYRVHQIFHVGGEGGWDYMTVDPEHKLLYVPRSTHTMVLDATTGKTIADIPGQKRNHGVVIVPSAGRGFITDGADASVTVFDLKTYAVLGKVKTADDADGVIYDPASGKVLVTCGDAGVVVPISADVDLKTGKADPSVDLGGKPEFLTADGRGKAYINLEDKDQVAVLDTKTMKVVTKWPVSPGGSPVGMSMDRAQRRLYVGCRKPQKLIVMSADDGKVLADLPIGSAWTPRNSPAAMLLSVAATARSLWPMRPRPANSRSSRTFPPCGAREPWTSIRRPVRSIFPRRNSVPQSRANVDLRPNPVPSWSWWSALRASSVQI